MWKRKTESKSTTNLLVSGGALPEQGTWLVRGGSLGDNSLCLYLCSALSFFLCSVADCMGVDNSVANLVSIPLVS